MECDFIMTLTVRLDDSMSAALAAHCAAHSTTKSRVVQESLAAYLMRSAAGQAVAQQLRASPAFSAFQAAGLLGSGSLGAQPADKMAVRRRVAGG